MLAALLWIWGILGLQNIVFAVIDFAAFMGVLPLTCVVGAGETLFITLLVYFDKHSLKSYKR